MVKQVFVKKLCILCELHDDVPFFTDIKSDVIDAKTDFPLHNKDVLQTTG